MPYVNNFLKDGKVKEKKMKKKQRMELEKFKGREDLLPRLISDGTWNPGFYLFSFRTKQGSFE